MRRSVLITLAAAGGVAGLLLVAIAIAIWRIDANDFAAPIQARIRQVTGRNVAINGGIDLKVSWTPRLVVRDLTLANAPWGRSPQMVTVKQLDIEVALLPLLRRRIDVARINLSEPIIAFETDAQGHANWDFGGGSAGSQSAGSASTPPAAFGVGNLAITGGSISYRDGRSGAVTSVAIDSLVLSARDPQSAIKAEFRGRVDSVNVALAGQLGPFQALTERRWPYPLTLAGEIGGQKSALAAKLRIEGDSTQLEDLEVTFGPNVVKGTLSIVTGGPRLRYVVNLTTPVLTLGPAAMAVAGPGKLAAVPAGAAGNVAASSAYLFSDAPLPLAILRKIDADGTARVDRLVASGTREFTAVEVRFTLHDGRLDVPGLKAATFGGNVDAHLTLDAPASGAPTLALVIDARNLDFAAELAAFGVHREMKGGKTSVKADLHSRGTTLHDWAASATGNVTAIAGPATINNLKLDPDSAFDRVVKAANPFREKDPTTELKCAVARLPLASGVARIDRSVAVETQQLGVSVSGTLDLRNESIDFTFKPQLREGITIELPQIAELIRLHGSLRHPQVSIDAMASVATAARIGAAFSTGGLSEVGVALFGAAGRGGAGPCAVALGASTASSSATAGATAPAGHGTDSLGKALGKLLGR